MKEQKTHVPMGFVLFMFGFKINRNHKMQMKLYDFCFHLKEIKKKKKSKSGHLDPETHFTVQSMSVVRSTRLKVNHSDVT